MLPKMASEADGVREGGVETAASKGRHRKDDGEVGTEHEQGSWASFGGGAVALTTV